MGWFDLKNGKTVLADLRQAWDFRSAVEQYCIAHHLLTPELRSASNTESDDVATEAERWLAQHHNPAAPAPPTVRIDWQDIALNRPGEQARKQADAVRAAAPRRGFFARLFDFGSPDRSWRRGAQGENIVAARLAKLPLGWHALHSISVGSRNVDIDHIVIGPAGVFTINAKHHLLTKVWVGGNTFMVNGQRYPYVRNARHEAQRATRLLSAAAGFGVDVRPVIAVVNAKDLRIKAQPDDVHVSADARLRRCFLRQPTVLSNDGVDHIWRAARKSTTWSSS